MSGTSVYHVDTRAISLLYCSYLLSFRSLFTSIFLQLVGMVRLMRTARKGDFAGYHRRLMAAQVVFG